MRTSHENEDKLISSNEDSIGVPEIIKTLYVLFSVSFIKFSAT